MSSALSASGASPLPEHAQHFRPLLDLSADTHRRPAHWLPAAALPRPRSPTVAHPGGGALAQRHDDAQLPRPGDGAAGSGEEPEPHRGNGKYNNNGRNGSFLRRWLPHRGKVQMACNCCFPTRTMF